MNEKNGPKNEKLSVKNKFNKAIGKIKQDKDVNRGINWLWSNRFILFCIILMFIGVIISFFHVHVGGILVGLAFGMSFYEEIRNYFFRIKGFYFLQGLYKTLLALGVTIYLLWALPAFLIATALGFFIIFLTFWLKDKD